MVEILGEEMSNTTKINKVKTDRMDEENLNKVILQYACPAIISGLVASIYNIVDQIFIGNIVGIEGNAATNVTFPLVTLTTAIMLLIGLGGAINFNIMLGRKELGAAKKYVGVILLLTPLAGVVISILTLLFSEELLWFFGATDSNFQYAYDYIRITAIGFPFSMASAAYAKLIRSDGSPKYSMICLVSGAILNCLLNPLFMIVFKMGMEGAAYATVVGQVISWLLTVVYFWRFKSFKISFTEITPSFAAIKQTLIMGASPALNQVAMMATQIVMNNVFSYYGELSKYGSEVTLACVGIISKVTSLYMAIMIGIAQGAQPLLGFSFGANDHKKVIQIYFLCIKYATTISLAVFIIFQVFPAQILAIFGANGELYFQFGISYFRIYMFMTFLNGIQPITSNFFAAIGKPYKSMIVSLSKQFICLIPLLIILPQFLGITGTLYAGPISDVIAFGITIVLVRKEVKFTLGN